MRLYVALSLLEEKQWRIGTGWESCMGGVEMCLRQFLRREMTENGYFGGHVSLYFEDANEKMVQANKKVATEEAIGSKYFSIDVLQNDPHSVNLIRGCEGWYAKWENAIVKLYKVEATDSQIEAIHKEALKPLISRTPYSMSVNVNSLCPCCCCPCFYLWPGNWCRERGLNCVSHVLTSLRAGLERQLVERRVLPGARLPSELVNELLQNGEIQFEKSIVLSKESVCETGSLLPPLFL
jgi:hypothetical protein